jgi:S-adenosylmethionine hydrolase
MPICALLSDFGDADYYVGAMKGTVLRLAPASTLVDITHEIPAGDVEQGAFVLASAVPSFPDGTVHLAVVDPGVGSARRMLVMEHAGQLVVAPVNGLRAPLAGSSLVCSVERPDLYLPTSAQTFHGRDRFAPIAAALLRGAAPRELGREVTDMVMLDLPGPRRSDHLLEGRVAHVDRFGNVVTDIPNHWLGDARFELAVGDLRTACVASHYAEIPTGVTAVLPGSSGSLELARQGESAAAHAELARGAKVTIRLGGHTAARR